MATETEIVDNHLKQDHQPGLSWKAFWLELWRLLRSFKKSFVVIIVITVLAAFLDLLKPYIVKVVIDGLTALDVANIWFLAQLIFLYWLNGQARSAMRYFSDRKILRLLVDLEYFLGLKAQEKLLNLSLAYHEKENTGAKIIKIEKGVDKISQFLSNMFWEVVPTLVELAFATGALFWADWRLGLTFMFFAPLYIYITYWANKRMYPVRKQIFRDYELASGKMAQSIININVVQSFVQEKNELAGFSGIKAHIRDNEDKQWGWMMKVGLGRNLVIDFGRAAILILGVYLTWGGFLTIGTLIFVFALSETAYASLFRLSRFYDRMEEGRAGVSRLLKLFSAQSEIVNKKNAIRPKKLLGEIKFLNVFFSYSDNKLPAVHDLNFKIVPAGMTALVGPSGGGKTTIVRLIYRHYDPKLGRIMVDGRDLRSYDVGSYRSHLAIVPQEVEIFDVSIKQNIAYARPTASFAEIQAAAKIANAEEFIDRLEQGYDSLVGERGIKLSGGQRQRLGIARAVLANPSILIFDEATSSLDSHSEFLIQDAMEKIGRNRTMIVIAHRLSTIKRADKIIVLEQGRVVGEGSHTELAQQKSGLYAKLLKLQALGEID